MDSISYQPSIVNQALQADMRRQPRRKLAEQVSSLAAEPALLEALPEARRRHDLAAAELARRELARPKAPTAAERREQERRLADRLIEAAWCIAGSEWAARCHCLMYGWIDGGRITAAGRRALRQLEGGDR